MSKSFQINGGDLVIGSARSFAVVTGKDKLFQDLKLWILERVGTDPATPTYGTTLDGGIIDGETVPGMIGTEFSKAKLLEIKAEIASLLEVYQNNQLEKMRREVILYDGNHTLSPDEILATVDSIEAVFLLGGIVLVRVTCTTLGDTTFQLTVPAQA